MGRVVVCGLWDRGMRCKDECCRHWKLRTWSGREWLELGFLELESGCAEVVLLVRVARGTSAPPFLELSSATHSVAHKHQETGGLSAAFNGCRRCPESL